MPDVKKKLELDVNIRGAKQLDEFAEKVKKLQVEFEKLEKLGSSRTPRQEARFETLSKELDQQQRILFAERQRFELAKKIANHKKMDVGDKAFLEKELALIREQRKEQERMLRYRKAYEDYLHKRLGDKPLQIPDYKESDEKRSFWSSAPGLKQLWGRFNPSAVLGRQIDSLRSARDAALARAKENNDADALAEAEGLNTQISQASGKLGVVNSAFKMISDATKLIRATYNVVNQTFKSVFGFSISIRDNFKDIFENVKSMTDMYSGMATYSSGSSLITNAAARNVQMQYGLSAGAAYGFDRARQMLGIQSDEDLLYMNESQRALFSSYMQRSQEFYNEMESSGVLQDIQEMQLEFALFKEELSREFLTFLASNKDEIMSILRGVLDVTKWILNGITSIVTLGSNSTSLSDAVSTSSYRTTNKTVNVTMTNNATGVISDQDQMMGYFDEALQRVALQVSTAIN